MSALVGGREFEQECVLVGSARAVVEAAAATDTGLPISADDLVATDIVRVISTVADGNRGA